MLLNTFTNKNKEQFYKLLNDASDDENNDENNDKNNEIISNIDKINNNFCQISNSNLEDNYIELLCGHKFNYIPLYNEVKYQKTNKYAVNYDYTKLALNQIKCPYCRTITNNILPYFKYYNLPTIKGVNYPYKYCLKINSCQHFLKSSEKNCCRSACITNNGIFCNRHFMQHNKNIDKSIDKNIDKNIDTMKLYELKNLLRKNKCRVSGNKQILIERIYYEKEKIKDWKD